MKVIGILWKKFIFNGYYENLGPIYEPKDYNFKRTIPNIKI
jgi:hypothetical protein